MGPLTIILALGERMALMPASMDRPWRSVVWFLVLTLGISWLVCGVWLFRFGLHNQVEAALWYMLAMWGPGLSALVTTRLVLHESWRTTTVHRLGCRRYYVWAWLFPGAVTFIAVILTLLFGVAQLDPEFRMLREAIEASGVFSPFPLRLPVSPGVAVAVRLAFVVAVAPLLNAPGVLGEELGWRGFLLPRLMRAGLSQWQALILSGIVWGLWHAPLIVQQQINYPGHPYLGIPQMIVTCIFLGIIFGWLQFASGSVWVPTMAHGALNGIASVPMLVLTPCDSALGGTVFSIIGWLPLAGFIAWLTWSGRLPASRVESQR
jgi:uncharacterized protein